MTSMTEAEQRLRAEFETMSLLRRDAIARGMHYLALLYSKSMARALTEILPLHRARLQPPAA